MTKDSFFDAADSRLMLSAEHIKDNVLSLRRLLRLSQGEFIEQYLSDESGKPICSVSKLSTFENRGSGDGALFARRIAQRLGVDSDIFFMDPDDFAKNIDLFLRARPREPEQKSGGSIRVVQRQNYVEVLVHAITDYLFDKIISGEFRPGSKLPSDRSLSEMFGVGRTSVREALKVLSVMGMIDILPGQGTFLASSSSSFFIAPLSWTFLLGEHNIEHIISVRNLLERESARLAADNAGEDDLRELSELFERLSKAYLEADFQNFLDLDLDFHLAIAKCSQNPIIQSLLLTTRKLIRYISKSGMVNLSHLKEIFEEHSLVYNAIISRDPADSAEKMRFHLEKSRLRYQFNK